MKKNLIIIGLLFLGFSFFQYVKETRRISTIDTEISVRQSELKSAIERGVVGQEKLEAEYMVERAKTHKTNTLKFSYFLAGSPFVIGLVLCLMGLLGSKNKRKKTESVKQ